MRQSRCAVPPSAHQGLCLAGPSSLATSFPGRATFCRQLPRRKLMQQTPPSRAEPSPTQPSPTKSGTVPPRSASKVTKGSNLLGLALSCQRAARSSGPKAKSAALRTPPRRKKYDTFNNFQILPPSINHINNNLLLIIIARARARASHRWTGPASDHAAGDARARLLCVAVLTIRQVSPRRSRDAHTRDGLAYSFIVPRYSNQTIDRHTPDRLLCPSPQGRFQGEQGL